MPFVCTFFVVFFCLAFFFCLTRNKCRLTLSGETAASSTRGGVPWFGRGSYGEKRGKTGRALGLRSCVDVIMNESSILPNDTINQQHRQQSKHCERCKWEQLHVCMCMCVLLRAMCVYVCVCVCMQRWLGQVMMEGG